MQISGLEDKLSIRKNGIKTYFSNLDKNDR